MSRLLALALASACLLSAAPALAANPWLERRPLNIAHQGGEIEAPSDTMYAFRTALAKGVDVLEMDVHLTADGHVVVLHDATVDRTTNGSGAIEDMTLAEVQALDAAHWFVPGEGTVHDPARPAADFPLRGIASGEKAPPEGYSATDFRIPTLEEVLQAFPNTLLNVELKPNGRTTPTVAVEAARLLQAFGRSDDVIVVAFNDASTEIFKALAPEIDTATGTAQAGLFWATAQGPLPGSRNPRHVALQVPMSLGVPVTNKDFIAKAHANDLAVHVWTINDERTMRDLLAWGADGIMTDRPTLLESILSE